jgi:hypothetical protein
MMPWVEDWLMARPLAAEAMAPAPATNWPPVGRRWSGWKMSGERLGDADGWVKIAADVVSMTP